MCVIDVFLNIMFTILNGVCIVFLLAFIIQGVIFLMEDDYEIIAVRVMGIRNAKTLEFTFIFLSAVLLIVVCLGGAAANRRSKICFFVYTGLMAAIALGFAITITQKEGFTKQEGLEKLEAKFNAQNNDSTAKETIDILQKTGHCCGFTGKVWYGKKFPPSCCGNDKDVCIDKYASKTECQNFFKTTLSYTNLAFGLLLIVPIVVAAAAVVGFLMTVYGIASDLFDDY